MRTVYSFAGFVKLARQQIFIFYMPALGIGPDAGIFFN